MVNNNLKWLRFAVHAGVLYKNTYEWLRKPLNRRQLQLYIRQQCRLCGLKQTNVNICVVWVCILISEQNTMLLIWVEFCNSNTSHVKKKNDKKKLINYVYQQWWIFEFKASLTERLRVPWKRRVVWAMCSFPKCITYISQAYSPSVSVIEPWKYFHFAVRSARAFAIHR